eukprot:gene32644-biopygen26460
MQDEFGRYWKLIDFGMATAKGSSKKSMRTTKAGSNEGTQGYMAPELYSRAGGTHKVDAFAFGVTIWELYAKTRPFEGVAEAAIGREVEKGARPPLAAVGERDVRALVAACWHQTPEARPEMADVVGGIEQGGGGGGGGGRGSGGGGGGVYAPVEPSEASCSYSSARGKCTITFVPGAAAAVFCPQHCCTKPGCFAKKASADKLCRLHQGGSGGGGGGGGGGGVRGGGSSGGEKAAAAASKAKTAYSGPTCTVDDVGVIPKGKYKGRTDLVGWLILPDTVTGIEGGRRDGAFEDCSGLTSVMIPAGVKTIGGSAFAFCSGLTSVTIPAGVKTIGTSAFIDCSGLTSVTIPAGVKTIDYDAFSGCSGLTSVTIPAGVKTIGVGAFQNCSGLTSVTIPAGVETIGDYAFQNCSGLTSVTIPAGVKTIGVGAFCGCSGLTSVTIPAGVETIGYAAFSGCSGLTSVTIPAGVKTIDEFAFAGCSGLTSVTIPAGVETIGEGVFSNCSGLTSVTIPAGVKTIGQRAFKNCSGLISVTVPASASYTESGDSPSFPAGCRITRA